MTITVKQLRKCAGDKRYDGPLPHDIALDELERLATLGILYEQVLRSPPDTKIRRGADGRWYVNDGPGRALLRDALNKAGIEHG